MRHYLSLWAILLIAVMVHLDWHFGRAHHHRLSLNLPYHWITGLATFFLLALFCARKWPENAIGAALLNGILGLFVGQIIEPVVELVGFRMPMSTTFTGERWRVFAEFAIASVVGLAAGVVVVRVRKRGRPAPA